MKLMYLLAGGSIAAFVASVPAYAQTVTDTAQPVEETRAPGDEEGLTPIVVTAQKRPENLQDVPISVIAVGGDDLKARGIVNTAELGTVIPGLNLRVTNNAFLPYIRGIGSNAGFSESPTSLYIDGVYVAQSRGALRDLNDIAQVAVLKGPQGTLFGRNSTAGVIQITTRRPTQDFRAEGGVSLDNYETLRSDAYLRA